MPPSRSRPQPNKAIEPGYEIVGLQPAESMPIEFQGRSFDLARLSAEDAEFLLQFPEQVPYIRPRSSAGE